MLAAVRRRIRALVLGRAFRAAVLVVTGTAAAIIGNIVPQLPTWPMRAAGVAVVALGGYVGIRVSPESNAEPEERIVERAGAV